MVLQFILLGLINISTTTLDQIIDAVVYKYI